MAKFKATIQYPKTPKLRIFKTEDGQFSISYAEEDPLNLRSETVENLDKEVQRLFGYSGWSEYKEKNISDLKKELKRDENGRIIQAPTVHPFHVAYGLDEFFNNFDVSQYEIIGIPSKMTDSNLKFIKAASEVVDLRRSFFGDDAVGRQGIVNIAMFSPEEGLENKQVITRAKEKWGDFDQLYSSKFEGKFVVRHPSGQAWKSNAEKYNDITSKTDEALVVDIKSALQNSSMLSENLEEGVMDDLADLGSRGLKSLGDFGGEAVNWLQDKAWKYTKEFIPTIKDLEKWSDGATGGLALDTFTEVFKFVDPTGISSWPDAIEAFDRYTEDVTDMEAGLDFAFSVLAAAPIAKWAVKGAKFGKTLDKMDDLARIIKRAPGRGSTNIRLGRDMQKIIRDAKNLDPTDARAMKKYAKKLADMADNVALSPAVRYNARAAAKKLDKLVPGAVRRALSVRKSRLVDLGLDATAGFFDDTDDDGGGGGYYDDGDDFYDGGGEQMPDSPISLEDLQLFIVPKNWRKFGFEWLTKEEKALAQRVGANSNFSMSDFSERESDQESEQQSLEGANILVFGHSQAAADKLGGTINRQADTLGAKVVRKVFSGNADGYVSDENPGLVNHLKKVPSKNYTHAFLFLGGNTSGKVSKSSLMLNAKKEIIKHTVSILGVPKKNILVILPPVNLDHEYSRSRIKLNKAATEALRNMGVKVQPQITGNSKDFKKDGYHIDGSSDLAKNATSGMFRSFSRGKSKYDDSDSSVPVPYDYIQQELGYDRTTWNMYRIEVGKIESANKYSLKGGAGGHYDGRYQIGAAAKQGGARHFGLPNPGHGSSERKTFRGDPSLQEKIFAGLTVGNHKALMRVKKYREASKKKKLAILGYAHNQGAVGGYSRKRPDVRSAKVWLETGVEGRDAFNTGGTKYYNAVMKGFGSLDNDRTQRPVRRRRRSSRPAEISSVKGLARKNNMKYFGNASGRGTGKWSSTYSMRRPTVHKVAKALGHIPYEKGGWFSNDSISSQWLSDNIVTVSAPIAYAGTGGPTGTSGTIRVNKNVAPYMLAAIKESRAKYGLPLTHAGSYVKKGESSGFSAHAFGAAIDLDPFVNPYTVGGLISRPGIVEVLKGGNYRRYWNFKNSRGRTYKDYLEESLRRGKKAISLYEFVGGPLNNNGIAKIFNKYGFRWGSNWRQARKDGMHFEFMPDYV